MTNTEYPTIKQFVVLLIFVGLVFGSFFFLVGTLPQVFGINLVPIYYSLVSLLSNFLWVPILLYLNRKSSDKWEWRFQIPGIRIFFTLILIVICLQIVLTPLGSIKDLIDNISHGKLMTFKIKTYDLSLVKIFQFIDLIILVPLFEEIFFRKKIISLLLRKMTPVYAIIASSILFTIFHFNFENAARILVWGIILGIFYYRTKRIEITIILHSINNLTSFFTYKNYLELSHPLAIFTLTWLSTSLALFFLIKIVLKNYISSESSANDK